MPAHLSYLVTYMITKLDISHFLSLPPRIMLAKISNYIRVRRGGNRRRSEAISNGSFEDIQQTDLTRIIEDFNRGNNAESPAQKNLCAQYRSHRFDILGSGVTHVQYAMTCPGLEDHSFASPPSPDVDHDGGWLEGIVNQSNLQESQRIWRMIRPDYVPIDWQLDFKSGFRWPASSWHSDITYGRVDGPDIKVPWELARMHHLVTLALGYSQTRDNSLFDEFRSQTLDFVATNPPGFGVNWTCSMEVAIRSINILLALDIFRNAGAAPDKDFMNVLARCIRSHGKHIIDNLEWTPETSLLGNHYLANIAGLVFIAAYVPSSQETDSWLLFGIGEFTRQAEQQFHEDGANFEASTSYHRLTSEIAAFTTAVIISIPEQRLEALGKIQRMTGIPALPGRAGKLLELHDIPWLSRPCALPGQHFDRLRKMAAFLEAISTRGRLFPQIGDNDNGRFVKLLPVPDLSDNSECHCDASPTLSAIDAVLGDNDGSAEAQLIGAIAGKAIRSVHKNSAVQEDNPRVFTNFGLCIYRTDLMHLIVRCGPVGKNGHGGHGHNDQLSFVLSLDGRPVFVDPGTYVYTPLPDKRNLFRSTSMHNTLVIPGMEQNPWPEGRKGLFIMDERSSARILTANATEFLGEHTGYGPITQRRLTLEANALRGTDFCDRTGAKWAAFHLAPDLKADINANMAAILRGDTPVCNLSTDASLSIKEDLYSPSYGIVQPSSCLIAESTASRISWTITW